MELPSGVKWSAALFFLTAVYLGGAGLLIILRPGVLPLTIGSSFLGGLELAGPYMFLLVALVTGLVGWGLLRLNRWARWAAVVLAFIGIVLLVPSVSSSVISFRAGALFWGGLGVIVRVMILWYLFQEPVAERFS